MLCLQNWLFSGSVIFTIVDRFNLHSIKINLARLAISRLVNKDNSDRVVSILVFRWYFQDSNRWNIWRENGSPQSVNRNTLVWWVYNHVAVILQKHSHGTYECSIFGLLVLSGWSFSSHGASRQTVSNPDSNSIQLGEAINELSSDQDVPPSPIKVQVFTSSIIPCRWEPTSCQRALIHNRFRLIREGGIRLSFFKGTHPPSPVRALYLSPLTPFP